MGARNFRASIRICTSSSPPNIHDPFPLPPLQPSLLELRVNTRGRRGGSPRSHRVFSIWLRLKSKKRFVRRSRRSAVQAVNDPFCPFLTEIHHAGLSNGKLFKRLRDRTHGRELDGVGTVFGLLSRISPAERKVMLRVVTCERL